MTTKKTMKITKSNVPFSGVITALVTPFYKGKIDYPSVKKLVRQQLDGGVQGFVINGTTGESPTLEESEVVQLFRFVKTQSDGAVPLILGTGSNSTKETIKKTQLAKKLKADAALVVVPYYNKPPQRGLIRHYELVAKSTTLPIILYNVPGRTVVSLSPESICQLAKIKNIVGVKEASGRVEILKNIVPAVGKSFLLSSGDDVSSVEFILAGGHGVISVISHVIPQGFRHIIDNAREKNLSARKEYKKYSELNKVIGIEANPIPVKMMLYLMGVIRSPELRLPLLAAEGDIKKKIEMELVNLGLV